MNEITVTIADASISEVWIAEALRARSSKAVMSVPAVVLFKLVEGQRGDIIHFTELSELSVNTVGADGSVTNQATTHTARNVTINTWQECTWRVAKRAAAQSVLDYMKEFSYAAGRRLGEAMDAALADNHSSITTNVEGSTTSPSVLTDDLVLAAIQDLENISVPAEDRTFVFHPKAKNELLKLDKFSLAYATGLNQGAQINGQFGMIYGIKVVVTPEVVSTGTPAVRKNFLLHKECMGMAVQRNINIVKKDPPDLSDLYIADVLYGEAVLRENHGVVINTAA